MIDQSDIASIVEEYDRLKLRIGMTASHSALDICDGAIEEGFPTVAYCKEGRHKTYANYFTTQRSSSGRVVRGRIGVAIGEVTREVAEALGLKTASGALVRSVDPEGPARKAGIEPGDIVLSFAGNKVARMSDLPRLVGKTQPGRSESIEVWRRGEKLRLTVSVAELQSEPQAKAAAPTPPEKAVVSNWLGLGFSDLTDEDRKRLNLKAGVGISKVSGPSERSGIRQGDIILSVNNTQVESASRLAAYLEKLDKRKPVVFLVRRGDGVLFIPVRP